MMARDICLNIPLFKRCSRIVNVQKEEDTLTITSPVQSAYKYTIVLISAKPSQKTFITLSHCIENGSQKIKGYIGFYIERVNMGVPVNLKIKVG